MRLSTVMAMVLVVPALALLLTAGEPGGQGNPPRVHVDGVHVTAGGKITGFGEGTPDVTVCLVVDGLIVKRDDDADPEVDGRQVNPFEFPAHAGYVGKLVSIRVLDASGQIAEVPVTVTPAGD